MRYNVMGLQSVIRLGFSLNLILWGNQAIAVTPQQTDSTDEIVNGLLSSFALPFDELLKAKHESEWVNLLDGFSGSIGLDIPLKKSKPAKHYVQGVASQGENNRYSVTMPVFIRYVPLSYWFINFNTLLYLDKNLQAPWNPDFTYSFGYDDWHPYTLSLTYENYGGNRFHPDRALGEEHTHYLEGTYRLGWKFPLAQVIAEPLLIETEKTVNCQLSFNLTPRYIEATEGKRLNHKKSVVLGCRYPIIQEWALNLNLFWYPEPEQQQPWDPDYTYSLTFPQKLLGDFTLQYSNYAGSRYPWREQQDAAGFEDGSFSLSWSLAW
ncbi:hypothetical protein BegalDRAFT_0540 [Beggiatoa alba B18LD]|uniref:Uncharacterized protein n=1 Tax=Beggiatoa alba B18LD TaxID=395493 RepID=I3CCW5_9GAMM|nr:hypothetical protein [Beggiatoa alba]EIJ41458.1 hypothetical protein BegalDRAFT_0540 [Beggiatoa alba B18LD]